MSYQSWMPHLEELRKRLIVSIAVLAAACIPVFIFYDFFFSWLTAPVRPILSESSSLLYASTVYEAFLVKLKFSLLLAFVFSLPVHILNICAFIFPALKKKEKKFLAVIIVSVFFLGISGALYAYKLVIPGVFRFFLSSVFYPDIVGILLNFDTNLFFIVQLILCFLVVMQFPVVLVSLLALRIVNVKGLVKAARIVIVLIFILAAFITPPDVLSQFAVAAPLVLIYFLTIAVGMLISPKKRKNDKKY